MTTKSLLLALPIAASLLLSPFYCNSVAALPFANKKPAATTAPMEDMEIRDKWAIVVGVNRFADTSIPPLKFAQKSSADLARTLKDADCGHFGLDHVLVVNGPDASKAGIEQAFNEWLFKKALPSDLVVIYFNSRVAKNANGDLMLCANDTKLADIDKTGVDLAELLKNARQRVGSGHMLCLLDTNPTATGEKFAHDSKWLATNSGIGVLSANELGKPSLDDASEMQTYFVHYFVEAMKTGGGNYPLAMVAEYVWQKVQEFTKTAPEGQQTPIMSLASEQSQTHAIPIGIMVRSSMPPRQIAIGHPMDTLGMNRPDIVAPTLNTAKTGVKLATRNPVTTAKVATASKPVLAAAVPPKPVHEAKTVMAETSDDDADDEKIDPSLDMKPYMTKMKQDIQKKWQMPKGLEARRVTVAFSIESDGKIDYAEIVEGSGNEAVDKSALEALKAASPLDPLPKGAPKSVSIKYVFDWKTRVGGQ